MAILFTGILLLGIALVTYNLNVGMIAVLMMLVGFIRWICRMYDYNYNQVQKDIKLQRKFEDVYGVIESKDDK